MFNQFGYNRNEYNGGLTSFSRSVSDATTNGASRLATLQGHRALIRGISDAITNGASRLATVARQVTYIRALTDAITNGASRLATVTRSIIKKAMYKFKPKIDKIIALAKPHIKNIRNKL